MMNNLCELCQNNFLRNQPLIEKGRKYAYNGNRCSYCRGNITPWKYKGVYHESCRCGTTETIYGVIKERLWTD
ncbi:MAG: hypothetical protein I3270_02530 [Candidatus Moeniiplasma glomeromycotorum]|nr:hypothetical protein [Candidatus Moeniiplasma glomeromycotorum]MCE8162577.1 hypothetical protein [Candidatus Moeniiplasma glomeromycotorum]MCE8166499.1 hypothetical protein [Candidatus Moeniiplasma glomeromycotorum]MCE8166960.1 hypothetical protein [Candidatus Moeniiplasma glomeromycotorum]